VYIFFLDIDGTLLWEGKISPRTTEWIERARKMGHKVFINTGRSLYDIPPQVLEIVPHDGIVSGLGASAVFGEKVLFESNATLDDAEFVLEFAERERITVLLESLNYFVTYMGNMYIGSFMQGREQELASVAELRERFSDIKISKFTFSRPLSFEQIRYLSTRFDVFNHEFYSEMSQKGLNKASAMKVVADYFGVGMEFTVAMGDSKNDKDMLDAAGISVVMGNAPDSLKADADIVTPHCAEGGVGYAIEMILEGRV